MGYDWPKKKKARYHKHQRRSCHGGCSQGVPRWHDSIEEARYCDQLEILMKGGEIRSYKPQVVYPLHDRFNRSCGYMRVDFEVIKADGKKVIHEYKGQLFGNLMEYKQKRALFSWCYPDVEYITVKKGEIVI